jgi:hypothetical protein
MLRMIREIGCNCERCDFCIERKEEIFGDYSLDELRRIQRVSKALRIPASRIIKMPFTDVMNKLACKVLELETSKDHNEQLLESIEKFLEENKK